MARVSQPPLIGAAISPLRLLAILIFLCSVTGGLVYLFAMPLKQVYWGVYARVRPFTSEEELLLRGKQLPGTIHSLQKTDNDAHLSAELPQGLNSDEDDNPADGPDKGDHGHELPPGMAAVHTDTDAILPADPEPDIDSGSDRGKGESQNPTAVGEVSAAEEEHIKMGQEQEPLQVQEEGQADGSQQGEEGHPEAHQDAQSEGQPGEDQPRKEGQQQKESELPLDKLIKQQGSTAESSGVAMEHALTKELVSQVVNNNMVVVTWANFHYRDFVMNWVEHLQETGCKAFIVGAMDDKLLEFLLEKKIPTFSMSSGLTLDDFGWGTPTFHKMGREKINLLYSFTKMGFDVLISDVDTVWLRNPIPYMQQYPDADVLTSSDHLLNTVNDEGLEIWPQAASAANIGIMLFRPKGHGLAAEWVEVLERDDNVWDQNAFNDLFRRGSRPLPDRKDRLFECYDGKLKCGILPVSIFCSGHTGFTQQMPWKLGLKPYVIHATFQFSGTPGKRHRMRELLMWNDPPEYFAAPKGFLLYNDTIPQELLNAVVNMRRDFSLAATQPHFDLVNYQITQLRTAFIVAQITGRVVILPKLMCGMDRWWAPHDGTIPGSGLKLPYVCPADHVLDLESMSRDLPEAEFGPNIGFREYSFLANPHALELNKSVLTLTVCEDGEERCADGSNPLAGDKVEPGRNEEQLKALLTQGSAADAKVLRIEGGMARLFGGFDDAGMAQRFKRRADNYGSIWCCVNAHPGHIWYDFFYDIIPHTDRHGREVEAAWEPITGP